MILKLVVATIVARHLLVKEHEYVVNIYLLC